MRDRAEVIRHTRWTTRQADDWQRRVTLRDSGCEREPMLLFLVKAFSSVIWNLTGVGC